MSSRPGAEAHLCDAVFQSRARPIPPRGLAIRLGQLFVADLCAYENM